MSIIAGKPQRVKVNGITLNARIDGSLSGNAPWMVFSNSLSSSILMWDRQVDAFGTRFRTLRYDQRGHGQSDVPPDNQTNFEELSSDLVGLMDHFGIDAAVLIGVSMGSTTVMRVAARFPDRCRAVVACDGQWRTSPTNDTAWDERIATATGKGMAALGRPTVERWFQPEFIAANPDIADRIEAMVSATPVGGYLACASAVRSFDYRADYPAIKVPVLFMAGAQDGNVPNIMREMANATPGSRFRVIDRCGHLPNIEQPEVFFEAVNGFVRDLGIG